MHSCQTNSRTVKGDLFTSTHSVSEFRVCCSHAASTVPDIHRYHAISPGNWSITPSDVNERFLRSSLLLISARNCTLTEPCFRIHPVAYSQHIHLNFSVALLTTSSSALTVLLGCSISLAKLQTLNSFSEILSPKKSF